LKVDLWWPAGVRWVSDTHLTPPPDDPASGNQNYGTMRPMKLYVAPMDAVVVEVRADGWIRLEHEDWSQPTLQERRAIIYAAKDELESLKELLEVLDLP
jgi:hypothetical protein